jgi:hypothetical protein
MVTPAVDLVLLLLPMASSPDNIQIFQDQALDEALLLTAA